MLTFTTSLIIAILEAHLEDADQVYAQYGELMAEYEGEIARFGDAWPGAFDQVYGMGRVIDQLDREFALLRELNPPVIAERVRVLEPDLELADAYPF